jgi:hypothetical protein
LFIEAFVRAGAPQHSSSVYDRRRPENRPVNAAMKPKYLPIHAGDGRLLADSACDRTSGRAHWNNNNPKPIRENATPCCSVRVMGKHRHGGYQ